MNVFLQYRTSLSGISDPQNPRATITASLASPDRARFFNGNLPFYFGKRFSA